MEAGPRPPRPVTNLDASLQSGSLLIGFESHKEKPVGQAAYLGQTIVLGHWIMTRLVALTSTSVSKYRRHVGRYLPNLLKLAATSPILGTLSDE